MKNPKLIIGIIAIVILLIIFFVVYKNSKRVTTKSTEVNTQQASFWDAISNLFNPKEGTSSGGGQSTWCKIFPKSCKPKKYCDCSKPGFAIDGIADSLCKEDGLKFELDCK